VKGSQKSAEKPINQTVFTEGREESLDFLHQWQEQSALGNLVRADTSRFVAFATFCENCLGKTAARPAVYPLAEGEQAYGGAKGDQGRAPPQETAVGIS